MVLLNLFLDILLNGKRSEVITVAVAAETFLLMRNIFHLIWTFFNYSFWSYKLMWDRQTYRQTDCN